MNKIYIISAMVVVLLGIISCSDNFLNIEPTGFLSEKQIGEAAENNPDVVAGTVAGIYTLMFELATGGSDPDDPDHDDFGQKGYDIYSDFLSSDLCLAISSYGWYRRITEYTVTTDFTDIINYRPWSYYYKLIRSTNTVILALGGNEVEPELEEKKHLMGQAKALRAYCYFYLAQFYSTEYNPAEEILPIYTDPNQPNLPKSTSQEVYALIEKDLTEAISLLETFNRTAKNQINKYVAKGLLAYTYAVMGGDKYSVAKTLTNDIIANGGFTIVDSTEVVYNELDPNLGGFRDINTSGWMWGVDITLDNGLDIISWWGQMDAFSYSYQMAGDRKVIDQGLYDAIPVDDVRKNQFYTIDNYKKQIPEFTSDKDEIVYNSAYALTPVGKFYTLQRNIGGQGSIETDYLYMRVAEMYLLNAEVAAKSNDETTARTSLKALVRLRVPNANYIDNLTGQALLDEIYLQTRIELWGEGKSYLAMKRNKATIVRGANHLSYVGEPIKSNDTRLTFETPQSEIQNNPHIN